MPFFQDACSIRKANHTRFEFLVTATDLGEVALLSLSSRFSVKWLRKLTWKCRMMVHIRPRVSFGLPSTMSSARMLTNLIFLYRKKSRAICTFCSMWKRIRPFSRGWKRTQLALFIVNCVRSRTTIAAWSNSSPLDFRLWLDMVSLANDSVILSTPTQNRLG